ncbi:laccase-15 [Prunus yedoensis var. nudiflora]|uniref:Laccase-15 n=1 Tax=Prunus yedoensis var. nudiflora TaxID=2094558 RepID=A0A314UG02_PRUYE|nr:laccase-15 [Prunus yedoensis var. nudiflora]
MNSILFFSIANHNLTVVGADGSYTKPVTRDCITISQGQTLDALLLTNQPVGQYYMAARAYSSSPAVAFDNTTTTAIVQYNNRNSTPFSSPPILPYLPYYNDTNAAFNFFDSLRSLANEDHPIDVPKNITTRLISTVSVNTFPCPNNSCEGPNGTRLAASMNNISFVDPTTIDILEAYYYHINGVFREGFPDFPPLVYNFTGEDLPLILQTPKRGTKVKVFDYGSIVECIFQGTNLVAGIDHPMHLHGFSFYIVGRGFGNFDRDKDPLNYNLVDPPHRNTVTVPISGWTAIRFKANNPGKYS